MRVAGSAPGEQARAASDLETERAPARCRGDVIAMDEKGRLRPSVVETVKAEAGDPLELAAARSEMRGRRKADVSAGQRTLELVDSHKRRLAAVARKQSALLLLPPIGRGDERRDPTSASRRMESPARAWAGRSQSRLM